MMAAGGIWPRSAILLSALDGDPGGARATPGEDPFAALSGWTPGS
jgi:hypothetical protein